MGSSPSLRPGRGGGCDIFPSPSSRPFSCDTADSYRGIIPASDRSADDSSTFSSPSLFCICVHTSLLTLIPPLFFFSPSWKSDLHLLIWGFFSQHVDSHHRRWAPKAVWWFNEASLLRVCVCVSSMWYAAHHAAHVSDPHSRFTCRSTARDRARLLPPYPDALRETLKLQNVAFFPSQSENSTRCPFPRRAVGQHSVSQRSNEPFHWRALMRGYDFESRRLDGRKRKHAVWPLTWSAARIRAAPEPRADAGFEPSPPQSPPGPWCSQPWTRQNDL